MLKIADIPVQERPRERLSNFGPASLSLAELIQVVLEKGDRQNSVLDISLKVLRSFANLEKLEQAKLEELRTVPGLGEAKAARLKAALELGKRFYQLEQQKTTVIADSMNAFKAANSFLKGKRTEHLLLLSLDVRNQLIGKPELISVGILDASLIHPREVFSAAIKANAAKIILAHNHPSGVSEPSDNDLAVTKQLAGAGLIMGIELLDHLIISKSGFYSIRSSYPELFN